MRKRTLAWRAWHLHVAMHDLLWDLLAATKRNASSFAAAIGWCAARVRGRGSGTGS
jgi:hypothetical protein